MTPEEPPYYTSYKGTIIKIIVEDGAQTWQNLQEKTGFSPVDLNKYLSEAFNLRLIEKDELGRYRAEYTVFKIYQEYMNSSESGRINAGGFSELMGLLQRQQVAMRVQPSQEKILPENEVDTTKIIDFKSEEFIAFIKEKLEELDHTYICYYTSGGSADLHKIYSEIDDDLRIFKVYRQSDEKIRQRFKIYDSISVNIDHPNVNKNYNTGKWKYQGKFYRWSILAYFHPHANSLEDINENTLRQSSKEKRLGLIFQLLEGLLAIRERYHCHNDIHAGNIMLSKDTVIAKIIDPGFSKKEAGRSDTDLEDFRNVLEAKFIKKKEKNKPDFQAILQSTTLLEMKETIANIMKEFFEESEDEKNFQLSNTTSLERNHTILPNSQLGIESKIENVQNFYMALRTRNWSRAQSIAEVNSVAKLLEEYYFSEVHLIGNGVNLNTKNIHFNFKIKEDPSLMYRPEKIDVTLSKDPSTFNKYFEMFLAEIRNAFKNYCIDPILELNHLKEMFERKEHRIIWKNRIRLILAFHPDYFIVKPDSKGFRISIRQYNEISLIFRDISKNGKIKYWVQAIGHPLNKQRFGATLEFDKEGELISAQPSGIKWDDYLEALNDFFGRAIACFQD